MARKKAKDKKSSSGGGFGRDTTSSSSSESDGPEFIDAPIQKESILTNDRAQGEGGKEIYSLPALYDLAFGYRSYDDEVAFLLDAHAKYAGSEYNGSGPTDILELAAGPARHSIASLRFDGTTVKTATAVDISPDMVKYGMENADAELGDAGSGGLRDAFTYLEGDMRKFCTAADDHSARSESIDSAWILLGSMQHLTTNDDVIECFESTARALRAGGTMLVELPHPRETFTMVECTRNGWEVPLEDDEGIEYGELRVVWGDDDDPFDPIRQVRDFTVAMELIGIDENEESAGENGIKRKMKTLQKVREVVPMRLFTSQEIDALARCAGLEVVAMYGALSDEVPVDSEDEAFRLVCVMRKV